jgi:hypothetical protein
VRKEGWEARVASVKGGRHPPPHLKPTFIPLGRTLHLGTFAISRNIMTLVHIGMSDQSQLSSN